MEEEEDSPDILHIDYQSRNSQRYEKPGLLHRAVIGLSLILRQPDKLSYANSL